MSKWLRFLHSNTFSCFSCHNCSFAQCQTAGHGLLSEMSLAELRERLARLKETQQEDKREKRERILEERQKEKQVLMEQLDTIKLSRRALAQAAAVR